MKKLKAIIGFILGVSALLFMWIVLKIETAVKVISRRVKGDE